MRELVIRPCLNGWLVQAGCQTLAYTNRETLLHDLAEYLQDPEKTENRIVEGAMNRRLIGSGGVMATPEAGCDAPRPMGIADAALGSRRPRSAREAQQRTTAINEEF